jgi:hypothetical protein
MSRVLTFTPLDTVDLLLDLQRFQVIELGLVRLAERVESRGVSSIWSSGETLPPYLRIKYEDSQLGVELVLAALLLLEGKYMLSNQRLQWGWREQEPGRMGDLRTDSFRSNKTTRPPLSPVAR